MEVNTKEVNNPIVQDTVKKTGAPRFYHSAIPWNYGCIPQTYEDPDRIDAITGLKGMLVACTCERSESELVVAAVVVGSHPASNRRRRPGGRRRHRQQGIHSR